MGLTIHYRLQCPGQRPGIADARRLLGQLRQKALDLPFENVGEIAELQGDAADFNRNRDWLLVQAAGNVTSPEGIYVKVPPLKLVAFTTEPGAGCEAANFGLCLFPKTVQSTCHAVRTNLPAWSWRSFCKTQYASNP